LAFLQLPQPVFKIARIDRPQKLSIIWDIANPSPGVMSPRPTAPATTLIAPRISAVLRIGGKASSTDRSRRGATVRSRQSRKAAGSPASASSTALPVSAVASPSSSSSAARVARFVEPQGRPAGLPDWPF